MSQGIPSCASSHERSLLPALLVFLAGIKNRKRAVKRTAVVSDKVPVVMPYLGMRDEKGRGRGTEIRIPFGVGVK